MPSPRPPHTTPRRHRGTTPAKPSHVRCGTQQSQIPPLHISHTPPVPTIHTKIAKWNINYQSSYDAPTKVCFHGDIDLLHITKPPAFLSILGTPAAATLTRTADKLDVTCTSLLTVIFIFVKLPSSHDSLASDQAMRVASTASCSTVRTVVTPPFSHYTLSNVNTNFM